MEAQFLFRLVQSDKFVEKVVAHSEGVGYPAINPSKLICLPIWIPPLTEQQAIARFLDRETAKIDTLIAKKERLIELLKEKRTALISHAVTKGLNPDAPMKDSGVEWLGKIPEHWEVKRLKDVALVNSATISEDTQPDYLLKYIDISNVDSDGSIL
ncbi:type I restriction endonuclease subunit S, partial [Cylindrospermopsis raciborskii S06]